MTAPEQHKNNSMRLSYKSVALISLGIVVMWNIGVALWRTTNERAVYKALYEASAKPAGQVGGSTSAPPPLRDASDVSGYWVTKDAIYLIADHGGDLVVRSFINELGDMKEGREAGWKHTALDLGEKFESEIGVQLMHRGKGLRHGQSIQLDYHTQTTLHGPNAHSVLMDMSSDNYITATRQGDTMTGVRVCNIYASGPALTTNMTQRSEFFATRRDDRELNYLLSR